MAKPREMEGVTPSSCPRCAYHMDAATCVTEEDARPKEGDFSVCLNCGQVLVFDAEGEAMLPTPDDLAKLDRDTKRQLFRATAAVRGLAAQRGHSLGKPVS